MNTSIQYQSNNNSLSSQFQMSRLKIIRSSIFKAQILYIFYNIFNYCMDDSAQEAQNLFDNVSGELESNINPFNEQSESESKHKKLKKEKTIKKDKKEKKHRHQKKSKRQRQYEQEDDQDENKGEFDEFFEDIADEDDDEQQENLSSAEILDAKDSIDPRYLERSKRRDFLQKFQGKNDAQINAYYNKEAQKRQQTEQMHPSERDPKMFTISCKVGRQEDLAYCILNKAFHLYSKNVTPDKKVKIVSVLAMKKKYPGKLFVEAFSQYDIRQSLKDFIDINLTKIVSFDTESYNNLFTEKAEKTVSYKVGDFIRIKKGLYEEDLGKIFKIKKHSVDVILVPRFNIQDFIIKMKQITAKLSSQDQIKKKQEQLLKTFINHRRSCPKNSRPVKKQLFQNDFKDIQNIPGINKLNIQTDLGLIILPYRYDEITTSKGTYLPIQIQPFIQSGKVVEQFQRQKQHFVSAVSFSKGDQIQIVAGQLTGIYGIIVDIKENIAEIKVKSKSMKDEKISQALQHIAKRFKQGQRVKVISGTDKGKTGIILKLEEKHAQILTDNQNIIKVNKNNLELTTGEVICEENVHNLKKDDLIKTSKNVVGIVLATRRDTIQILDTSNTVQIINNLDFDTKINSRALASKNNKGDIIKNQSIIRILKGAHEGKRCQVKHVYKDFLFLFNETFDKTNGVIVQKADNCSIISRTSEMPRKNLPKNSANSNQTQQQLYVGKSIIIKSGPLKGYQGTIKTINRDRIEVRVPSKSCNEWVLRDHVLSNEKNTDIGKTPRRGPMNTNLYAPSPMNNY